MASVLATCVCGLPTVRTRRGATSVARVASPTRERVGRAGCRRAAVQPGTGTGKTRAFVVAPTRARQTGIGTNGAQLFITDAAAPHLGCSAR
ncbi:MAG: hypothetical protein BGO98_50135 [Myxococcales bacterium 68-20]|nr:MAG: hypothetical protein BGO98_50135 [Myxococcales bacterium 68-20]